jgi:hypothetical protein
MGIQSDVYKHQKTNQAAFEAAEAFYKIFRALPREERVAITQYILADEDVRKNLSLLEIPNGITIHAFLENKQTMASFDTVNELREDLLS